MADAGPGDITRPEPPAATGAVAGPGRRRPRFPRRRVGALAAGCAVLVVVASPAPASPRPPRDLVVTSDVDLFYRVYDAAGGAPSAAQLDRDYLAAGTPALRRFAAERRVTGARIAAALAERPAVYEQARACLAVLPGARRRLAAAFASLARLYPKARLAPVTFVVGRGRPVGMTDEAGVTMGLEALCAADFMDPDLEARFVHTIAHEYGHLQQPHLPDDAPPPTLLAASLREGAAEFTAELISGAVGNHQHLAWTKGREAAIEAAFARDLDSTDLSRWIGNGPGDAQHPGDLGYWVGYRIVKAYYARAPDKARALAEIYALPDPRAFLAASGWRPAAASQVPAASTPHPTGVDLRP